MPSVSVRPRLYQPGTYTVSVDRVAKADTEWLLLEIDLGEDWPADPAVEVGTAALRWDTGGGGGWVLTGGWRNQDGTPAARIVLRTAVPREGEDVRKRDVGNGEAVFTVLRPVTVGLTIRSADADLNTTARA